MFDAFILLNVCLLYHSGAQWKSNLVLVLASDILVLINKV